VLELAGRVADIVAFNFNNAAGRIEPGGARTATAGLTDERVRWAREAADGRTEPVLFEVGIAATAVTKEVAEAAHRFEPIFGMDAAEIVDHPHALVGDEDAICDRLIERRERWGCSYVTIPDTMMDEF